MQIGPYSVVSPLGKGGMGTVLRVRAQDGRELALKLITGGAITQRTLERFERERRLLSELGAAEGFVSLLDSGVSDMGPWIVMPLVLGGTLRDRMKNGALPIDESVEIATTIARAIGRAHALGIVH